MTEHKLSFDLVDLPSEGITLTGEVFFADLEIEKEPRIFYPNPIHYELHFAPVNSDDLLLTGKLSSEMAMICDRCEVKAPFFLTVNNVCHEYEDAFGKPLDLTADIREDILLNLPQHFLCREDCKGLCPFCGINLNTSTCNCNNKLENKSEEVIAENPFQQLDKLKF
ncbi:MAG: DUF177 domain-containing protein [Lentisphaeria bacterium]